MQKTTRFCIESDNTIILLSAVVILHILSNAVSLYVINKQYSQAQLLARGSAEKRTMMIRKMHSSRILICETLQGRLNARDRIS